MLPPQLLRLRQAVPPVKHRRVDSEDAVGHRQEMQGMSTESIATPAGIVGKILAVLCLAGFWVLPFSPFVAIAAVATTRHSAGWPRTLAKTGAILSVLFTLMGAALLLWVVCIAGLRGWNWAF
jgi:hypothetical protein